MPGSPHPEASFPSSHTMMVCVIMGSAMMLTGKYITGTILSRVLRAGCAVVIFITIIGRLISGVHWFTDIAGGILISATLLNTYADMLERIKENNE